MSNLTHEKESLGQPTKGSEEGTICLKEELELSVEMSVRDKTLPPVGGKEARLNLPTSVELELLLRNRNPTHTPPNPTTKPTQGGGRQSGV